MPGVHVVQTLASAVGHAGDGVVGHMGLDAGVGLDELVEAPDQAAAAGHDDAVGGDVGLLCIILLMTRKGQLQ